MLNEFVLIFDNMSNFDLEMNRQTVQNIKLEKWSEFYFLKMDQIDEHLL